jgi:AraC-like DNA-binding protein
LKRGRLFETHDVDEARDMCGRVFSPHQLHITRPRQQLHASMDSLPFGAMSISRLTWGAAVDVDPQRLGNYYLLCIGLSGTASFEVGRERVQVTTNHAGLVSAAPRFRFSASSDFEQLVLRLERPAIDAAWLALSGRPASVPIDFAGSMALDAPAWSALGPLLHTVAAGLRGEFDGMALRHLNVCLEEQVCTTLLLLHPHNQVEKMDARGQPDSLLQRRAEEWMLERIDQPVTVTSAARACGVAVRTLQASFQRVRGMGPMQWLRRQRLDAVRTSLMTSRAPRQSIAQTAMQYGWTHLGEFSRAYRSAFGESARETLGKRH